MLLIPKKTKYRYNHSTSYEGKSKGNSFIVHGDFGIRAKEGGYISNRAIEAARKVTSRFVKRKGKVWIRVFPHLGKTQKPLEVRMGSGKGSIEKWVAVVKKGTFIFEIQGLDDASSINLFRKVNSKLPVDCEMIKRNQI